MWIKSEEKKPTENQVLVLCWVPFFGKLVPEIKVGYYDNPEDYESPDQGKGWLTWDGSFPIIVSHWQPLPAEPEGLQSIDQKVLSSRPSLGTLKVG